MVLFSILLLVMLVCFLSLSALFSASRMSKSLIRIPSLGGFYLILSGYNRRMHAGGSTTLAPAGMNCPAGLGGFHLISSGCNIRIQAGGGTTLTPIGINFRAGLAGCHLILSGCNRRLQAEGSTTLTPTGMNCSAGLRSCSLKKSLPPLQYTFLTRAAALHVISPSISFLLLGLK